VLTERLPKMRREGMNVKPTKRLSCEKRNKTGSSTKRKTPNKRERNLLKSLEKGKGGPFTKVKMGDL